MPFEKINEAIRLFERNPNPNPKSQERSQTLIDDLDRAMENWRKKQPQGVYNHHPKWSIEKEKADAFDKIIQHLNIDIRENEIGGSGYCVDFYSSGDQISCHDSILRCLYVALTSQTRKPVNLLTVVGAILYPDHQKKCHVNQ